MLHKDHDWYMDYDAMDTEDTDESHLTLSFRKKAAARMASAMAAAEREKEFGEEEGEEAEAFDFTGVRSWSDSSAYGEEKKRKIAVLFKRVVPAPVPPSDVLKCSRPLSAEEGAEYLKKACGDGARYHRATLVT